MIVLDGNNMTDRAQAHTELKCKLALPEYYGENLDALNDCLFEGRERPLIVIEHAAQFLEGCEGYGAKLLRVFADNDIQVLLD